MSDYFSGGERKANSGNCCQPCRWSYKLVEETRPGEYYEINQDERGSHILCPKDLCLVKRLPELIDAGIDSFKIEGRTKSLYYVSAVAKTYRQVLDGKLSADEGFEELLKVGNRGYTQGFAFGAGGDYNYEVSKGLAGADFLFEIWRQEGDSYEVKIKNKIHTGDQVEIITPDEQFSTVVVEIKDKTQNNLPLGNTNDEVFVKFLRAPKDYKYALGRRG